jgi:hypothetical protein
VCLFRSLISFVFGGPIRFSAPPPPPTTDRVFTLQTKCIWRHNNDASSEKDYVSERSRCRHRRRLSEAFARLQIHKANHEAWKIGVPMGSRRAARCESNEDLAVGQRPTERRPIIANQERRVAMGKRRGAVTTHRIYPPTVPVTVCAHGKR